MTEISRQWLLEADIVRPLVEFLHEKNFEICSQAPGQKQVMTTWRTHPMGVLRIEAKGGGFSKA
jgi:hypothetical protein